MKKHVRLKGTVCFSVCNGSFLLKERPVGFKGKTGICNHLKEKHTIYYALVINYLQVRKILRLTNFPKQRFI